MCILQVDSQGGFSRWILKVDSQEGFRREILQGDSGRNGRGASLRAGRAGGVFARCWSGIAGQRAHAAKQEVEVGSSLQLARVILRARRSVCSCACSRLICISCISH